MEQPAEETDETGTMHSTLQQHTTIRKQQFKKILNQNGECDWNLCSKIKRHEQPHPGLVFPRATAISWMDAPQTEGSAVSDEVFLESETAHNIVIFTTNYLQ